MTQQENIQHRATEACELLKRMIEIPSCTFEEEQVADFLSAHLEQKAEELRAKDLRAEEQKAEELKTATIITAEVSRTAEVVRTGEVCKKEEVGRREEIGRIAEVGRREEIGRTEEVGRKAEKAEGVGTERGKSSFKVLRIANNIVAVPDSYNPQLKTLMLNAHIDTVKPVESYANNPYEAIERDGKIYGLGSNDDGGSVVALIESFLYFTANEVCNCEDKREEDAQIEVCNCVCKHSEEVPVGKVGRGNDIKESKDNQNSNSINIILVLSAEEERSGATGVGYVLEQLAQQGIKVDFAIVGEPTGMRAAVAERGLLVLDGTAYGVSGHAARDEGENALYKAMDAIHALRKFKFAKHSHLMGSVKLTVTQINAGTVHNVIPDRCTFVVDIRPTEQYTNSEILSLLQNEVGDSCTLVARNLKNRSSATPQNHLLMKAVLACGIETFVSPTTSDWMRLSYTASAKACINTHAGTQKSGFESIRTMDIENIPAIKIGPGDSARSHKADEYILKEEISNGIETYIHLIENIIVQTDRFN